MAIKLCSTPLNIIHPAAFGIIQRHSTGWSNAFSTPNWKVLNGFEWKCWIDLSRVFYFSHTVCNAFNMVDATCFLIVHKNRCVKKETVGQSKVAASQLNPFGWDLIFLRAVFSRLVCRAIKIAHTAAGKPYKSIQSNLSVRPPLVSDPPSPSPSATTFPNTKIFSVKSRQLETS